LINKQKFCRTKEAGGASATCVQLFLGIAMLLQLASCFAKGVDAIADSIVIAQKNATPSRHL